MVALLFVGAAQFMVGCFSYKAMIVPAAEPAARLTEQVKRILPGKDYKVILNDGKTVDIKISGITTDAIFGNIELKDANGDRIYSPSGQVVSDTNYRIPLAEVADIRARKLSVGKTIVAIAVPVAAAAGIGIYILLTNIPDPAPANNSGDSISLDFGL